jgi:hypothetical protein
MKLGIGLVFLLVIANVPADHYPSPILTKKVRVECVDPESALNYNRTATPGVIRYGEHGENLYQFSRCWSA